MTHGSPSKFACFAVQPDKGIETSTITAILKDTNNNPISGAKVNFSTDKGTFNPKSAKTDNDGVASTVLTCQDAMVEGVLKTAKVKAEYTNLTCRVAVNFTPKEAAITCSANPSSTTGSTSTITAILKDTNNNPIQGAKVNFSTDKGQLNPLINTNDDGKAINELTCQDRGTAKVTARYGEVASCSVNVDFTSPQTMRWDCINGECKEVVGGEFESKAKCKANCKPIKWGWNCVNQKCVKALDGQYESEEKCKVRCEGHDP